jgi:formiminotetrahydrofolate cyclodeaminase
MACAYTTRSKDEQTGAAAAARALSEQLSRAAQSCLELADRDAQAYERLQATWRKDHGLEEREVAAIRREALEVPMTLLRECHAQAAAVRAFLPRTNPGIVSDSFVSLHLLAGAGRAAYQTALVNQPDEAARDEMQRLLSDLGAFEKDLLKLSS